MDIKTVETVTLVIILIFAALFILLVTSLPVLYLMEKAKQKKKLLEENFVKLQE